MELFPGAVFRNGGLPPEVDASVASSLHHNPERSGASAAVVAVAALPGGGDQNNMPPSPKQQMALSRSRLIRMYQVLSPGLAGRAHVFGSALALNADEWTKVDGNYFDAPGR